MYQLLLKNQDLLLTISIHYAQHVQSNYFDMQKRWTKSFPVTGAIPAVTAASLIFLLNFFKKPQHIRSPETNFSRNDIQIIKYS